MQMICIWDDGEYGKVNLEDHKDMFLSETTDHIQKLNGHLLILEKDPGNEESLNEIFRSTHTIKGMAAMMEYKGLEKVSHELESALDPYRRKKRALNQELIQLVFEGIDLLDKLKEEVEEGKVGSIPIKGFLSKVQDVKKEGPTIDKPQVKTTRTPPKRTVPKGPEPAAERTPSPKPLKAEKPKAKVIDYPQEVLKDVPISEDVLEYLDISMSESRDNLQSLNEQVLILEKDPGNEEALASVFRSAHTLKGMAATMGFTNMNKLTHELETALDYYRKTKRPLTEKMVNVTFECLDKLEKLNDEIKDGKVGGVGIRDQMLKIRTIIEENGPWQDALKHMDEGKGALKKKEVPTATQPAKPLTSGSGIAVEKPTTKAEKEKKDRLKVAAEQKALKGTTSIRISIENLENLMNLVGELVINKSRLVQIGKSYELLDLNEAMGRIDRLTTDLQDEVLKMRMVPTRYIFNRFPRMVRDLARAEGKEIEFIIIGWDIELDRTVLDEISEPLVHLLRNSIDHGIETPKIRKSLGKPKKGTVKLVAVRAKNNVKITLEDDGKGIDPEVIKKKALEKGLVDETKAQELTEQECIDLLFLPGFSTSSKVTAVSGRGVGMDVVKTKIESLGGMTEMTSVPGKGTKTVLTLPLTMAIIRALLVTVGLETYAIPISMVVETGKVNRSKTKTVHGKKVIVQRDEVVSIIDLHDTFQIEQPLPSEELTLVFVERGEKKLGLLVDYLIGQQEIVIKPLGKIFQNVRGIGGATILGDGRVALILDIATLI